MQSNTARTADTVFNVDLDFVLSFEHPELEHKIARKYELSELEAKRLFKDMLRFLFLGAKYGDVAPTEKIDNAWHEFILYTRDYREFCHAKFGRFLDHHPGRKLGGGDSASLKAKGKRTHSLALAEFGTLSANWSAVNGDCSGNCGTSDCEPTPSCEGPGKDD